MRGAEVPDRQRQDFWTLPRTSCSSPQAMAAAPRISSCAGGSPTRPATQLRAQRL